MLAVLLFMTKLGVVIGIVMLNLSSITQLAGPRSNWHENGTYSGMFLAGAFLLILSLGIGLVSLRA